MAAAVLKKKISALVSNLEHEFEHQSQHLTQSLNLLDKNKDGLMSRREVILSENIPKNPGLYCDNDGFQDKIFSRGNRRIFVASRSQQRRTYRGEGKPKFSSRSVGAIC